MFRVEELLCEGGLGLRVEQPLREGGLGLGLRVEQLLCEGASPALVVVFKDVALQLAEGLHQLVDLGSSVYGLGSTVQV